MNRKQILTTGFRFTFIDADGWPVSDGFRSERQAQRWLNRQDEPEMLSLEVETPGGAHVLRIGGAT